MHYSQGDFCYPPCCIIPTVTVGSTVTTPPGTRARVTASPTPCGVELDFAIPRGNPGRRDLRGRKGLRGRKDLRGRRDLRGRKGLRAPKDSRAHKDSRVPKDLRVRRVFRPMRLLSPTSRSFSTAAQSL